jgi:hypothetical protein
MQVKVGVEFHEFILQSFDEIRSRLHFGQAKVQNLQNINATAQPWQIIMAEFQTPQPGGGSCSMAGHATK